MTATPANWYPDPSDPARIRWWDGERWTDHTQPHQSAEVDQPAATQPVVAQPVVAQPVDEPAAAAANEPVTVVPTGPDEHAWITVGFDKLPDPVVEAMVAPPAAAEPMPAATRKRSIVPWLVAVGAVLLIGGGLALWATSDDDDAANPQPATTTRSAPVTVPLPSTTTTASTTTRPSTTAPPATTGPSATTATTAPGSTTTLSNSVLISDPAFRMSVSSRWEETRAPGLVKAWFTGGQSPAYRDNVNVVIERLPADLTLQEYVAASIRNAPSAIPTFVEIGNSIIDVNGKKLGQIDFRQTQGGLTLRHRAIVSIKGRNAVTVTYTTQPERFEVDVPGIMPFLTSVEAL